MTETKLNLGNIDLRQWLFCVDGFFFFYCQVPGLAENRPSVVRGDQILVRIKDSKGQPEKEEYQGFVHILGLNDVHLKFSPKWVVISNNCSNMCTAAAMISKY